MLLCHAVMPEFSALSRLWHRCSEAVFPRPLSIKTGLDAAVASRAATALHEDTFWCCCIWYDSAFKALFDAAVPSFATTVLYKHIF